MSGNGEGAAVELEERVEKIRDLLAQKRRPLFIEFAGTPKSGKTTVLNAVQMFLKRNGVAVRVYQERASVAPLSNKGAASFNTWVTCTTLTGMIEALEDDKLDVFILDRGLFDGLVWIDWQERTLRLTHDEAEHFRNFILTPRWWGLVDTLFVMHCKPEDSIVREYTDQITRRTGSIMNKASLSQLKDHLLQAAEKYRSKCKSVHLMDTSAVGRREAIVEAARHTLDALEGFADEEVLCVPQEELSRLLPFNGGTVIVPDWTGFVRLVDERGEYIRRSRAESDDSWVQIVPVCVIRYGDKYLTNLRYEPGESLHDTLANWAGGHVRKQDLAEARSKWDSVIVGLKREVHEELAIAELPNTEELGLVHTRDDDRAARHLGVVFQVQLNDAATAATLDGKTIKERPNKHVKTAWMETGQLAQASKQKDWSKAISGFLAGTSGRPPV